MSKFYTAWEKTSMREGCRKALFSCKPSARPGGRVARPFRPEPGRTYENRGGGFYQCLAPSERPNCAVMENIRSGWRFTAHDIVQYEDGSIDWAFSTSGRFVR